MVTNRVFMLIPGVTSVPVTRAGSTLLLSMTLTLFGCNILAMVIFIALAHQPEKR